VDTRARGGAPVVSKYPVDVRIGNDGGSGASSGPVVSKCRAGETSGNDAGSSSDPVVSISVGAARIGNDAGAMFVRVRRRKLKGGHADWRSYREARGILQTDSASFDLVRAVRIDGKPRQKFLLGLGSLKFPIGERELAWFWWRALRSMISYGLSEERRAGVMLELERKGVPLPAGGIKRP
jgi:hypothetical protein